MLGNQECWVYLKGNRESGQDTAPAALDYGALQSMRVAHQIGASLIPTVAEVPLEVGSPLHLDCGVHGQHRHCFWETEDGRVFQVGDVHAGRHAGLRAPHNITNNQCGIVVEQVTARDAGTWICRVFLQGKSLSSVKNVVRKEPKACQPPFVAIDTGCFYFSSIDMNWYDARTFCHSLSTQADLAVVDDCYLMQLIWSHMIDNYGDHTFWIGATDEHLEGAWRWVDGTSMTMGTPFWGPGEPNSAHKGENCLSFYYKTSYFNDDVCSLKWYFICQDNSQQVSSHLYRHTGGRADAEHKKTLHTC